MNSAHKPLVQVDQILRIPQEHYLYGSGLLVLRVTAVDPNLDRYPGLEWVHVKGTEILSDGKGGQPREVMIRAAALRHSAGSDV